MLIIQLLGRLRFLLTMSVVNEDVLWLEPLLFDINLTMVDSTFSFQVPSSLSSSSSPPSSASSNTSSLSMSILTTTATSLATVLSKSTQPVVLKWCVRIIGGLLIVIGGIGNTLSALTLSRKKLRAQVTSIYLIALALSDLGNVFFSVLNFYIIRLAPEHNMRLHGNLACKLHIFFTYYFINLSPTFLVAVSVQRYLAIAKHHYSKRRCTVKSAYTIIAFICFVSIFIQLHYGIFYEFREEMDNRTLSSANSAPVYKRICSVPLEYSRYMWFRSNMIGYIQWFFFTLCPFVTMLILNSLILKVVASARRIQQRINQKNQRKQAKQRNMTIMLLSVSCVFILLTAPASTFMAFGHLAKNLDDRVSQSLWTTFSLIYYANTAANFLLYFLTADVFRQELRVMIGRLPGCSKLLPDSYRNAGMNLGVGQGAGGFVAAAAVAMGKNQMNTLPLLNPAPIYKKERTSTTKAKDYEKHNGTKTTYLTSNVEVNADNKDEGSDDEDTPL